MKDDKIPGFIIEGKKALIFDFDGTIADTEPLQWMAYNECLKAHGVELSSEDIDRYMGNPEYIIYSMIKSDFGIDYDEAAFFRSRVEAFMRLVVDSNLKPFGYVIELLERYPLKRFFILSAQKLAVINKLLGMWGIIHRFEGIISVSEGPLTKELVLRDPLPHFGVGKREIIFFEDSVRALETASKEGVDSVGIEHEYNRGRIDGSTFIIRV
jgi:beta-phosphoglucomutase-like phosphatase (HAD superfamily)